MPDRKPRLLIADDDYDMRTILSDYLTHYGYEVTVAPDGEQALTLAARHVPDVALLDVRMPGPSGATLAERLKTLDPEMEVIIITAYGTIAEATQALRGGVFHYLTKPLDKQQLLATVQEAWAKRQARTCVQVGESFVALRSKQVTLRGEPLALTDLEFDLLAYLAQRRGQVVSYDELLEQVWQFPLDSGTPKLVQMAVSRLRCKLGDDPDAPRYIESVRKVGYRLP